jgi:hypothetical protein
VFAGSFPSPLIKGALPRRLASLVDLASAVGVHRQRVEAFEAEPLPWLPLELLGLEATHLPTAALTAAATPEIRK